MWAFFLFGLIFLPVLPIKRGMNKRLLPFYLALLLQLVSCSNIQVNNNKKISLVSKRNPASGNMDNCKELLDSYFQHIQSSWGEKLGINKITSYDIPFTLPGNKLGHGEIFTDKVMDVLLLRYPGLRHEVSTDSINQIKSIVTHKFINSKYESFEIILTSIKGKKSLFNLSYSGVERSVDQEFYYDTLSLLINKKILRLKVGDLKGRQLLEKVKNDLIFKSINKNFLLLKIAIFDNKKTSIELVSIFKNVFENVSEFKKQVYLSKDRILINNYLDLVSEIHRLKEGLKHEKKRSAKVSL